MNQGIRAFDILAKENVHVQIGTDKFAFHHALETDWGGGGAILFPPDPLLLPTYSTDSESHCFGSNGTLTENLCCLEIELLSLPLPLNVGIWLVRNGFKQWMSVPLRLTK